MPLTKQYFKQLALAIVPALIVCFSGCAQNTEGSINEDIKALLVLNTGAVLDLEKKQDYSEIYQNHFSQMLKDSFSEEAFLKRANCVESYLGPIKYYSQDFNITEAKQPYGQTYPLKTVVTRATTELTEEFQFIREGIHFKLLQIHWQSDNKALLGCLRALEKSSKEISLPSTHKPFDTPLWQETEALLFVSDSVSAKPTLTD